MDLSGSTSGHEQSGKRPYCVISKEVFNHFTNMVIVAPLTRTYREFPSHLRVHSMDGHESTMLLEHMRSVDINSREYRHLDYIPEEEMEHAVAIVQSLFR